MGRRQEAHERAVEVKRRRRISAAIKKSWASPEKRAQWIASMKAAAQRPEVREARIAGQRKPATAARRIESANERTMQRYGLTAEEVPVWRELKTKLGGAGKEAADVIKRSRKREVMMATPP